MAKLDKCGLSKELKKEANTYNNKTQVANPKGKEWYNLRPVLGNANWAIFYILLGGREAGVCSPEIK